MNSKILLPVPARSAKRALTVVMALGVVSFLVAPTADARTTKLKAPKITCAWARQSPSMAAMGAAYMKIQASSTDRLVSVTGPTSVSKMIQIHEMVPASTTAMAMGEHDHDAHMASTTMAMSGGTHDHDAHMASTTMAMSGGTHDHDAHMASTTMAMSGGTMAQMMVMQEVKGGLALAANKTVELKPGSYHIMFMGLVAPLKTGQKIPLSLKFEKYGTVKVTVPVMADQPVCK